MRLRKALLLTGGNITRAALTLDVSEGYCRALVKAKGLGAWARELRWKSGSPATGRPRKTERR